MTLSVFYLSIEICRFYDRGAVVAAMMKREFMVEVEGSEGTLFKTVEGLKGTIGGKIPWSLAGESKHPNQRRD